MLFVVVAVGVGVGNKLVVAVVVVVVVREISFCCNSADALTISSANTVCRAMLVMKINIKKTRFEMTDRERERELCVRVCVI